MKKIQWMPDICPAMITDDIAFVGGSPVSVHCLLSDDGLILLDTGYPGMLQGIRENMEKLGLQLSDVRYVLHSHGHIDHYGSTAEIVRLSGAKTLIGKEDAPIVRGEEDLSWAKELEIDPAEEFIPDVLFSDGDMLELGGRKIRCIHAPGHTFGTYAFFVETKVDGVPKIAAMHGGVGMNSLARSFLGKYGFPLTLRDEFRAGLKRLSKEKVDIVLGNHPGQNNTPEKIARFGEEENPFVDSSEWVRFLAACEMRLDDMISGEKA